jgi:hypothetical protein
MTRHRQKDEEAGAEGYGILNTRKVSNPRTSDVHKQHNLISLHF